MSKAPNPVDVHVGGRIRLRRMVLGMSQEKLGDSLGLTFQQIQKYEKGTNRVSASRLLSIGEILGVPVSFFYEGLDEALVPATGMAEADPVAYVMDFVNSPEGLQLNMAFNKIKNPETRKRIVDLVKTLVAAEGPETP